MSILTPYPSNVVQSRDVRLDFFRGVGLFMIFVDHLPNDPIGRFTYHAWGFSDASEIFVFLSGVACSIAYSGVLARRGLPGLIKYAIRRATRLWIAYAITGLMVVTVVLLLLATGMWRDGGTAALFESHYVHTIVHNPLRAVIGAFTLTSPSYASILALYIFFTLLIIPTFFLVAKYGSLLPLVVSGIVWLIVQCTGWNFMPAELDRTWFFDPVAWQFVFVIGMTCGQTRPLSGSSVSRSWVVRLLPLAWTIVIGSFLYKFVLVSAHYLGHDASVIAIPRHVEHQWKKHLAPPCLIHFLSIALLVAYYFKLTNPIFRSPLAAPLIKSGTCSLELYCLSVVLAHLAEIPASEWALSRLDYIAMVLAGFAVMAMAAMLLRRPDIGSRKIFPRRR